MATGYSYFGNCYEYTFIPNELMEIYRKRAGKDRECPKCDRVIPAGVNYCSNANNKNPRLRFCSEECLAEYYTLLCASCDTILGIIGSGPKTPKFCRKCSGYE